MTAAYTNHACNGNAMRSFIGDMMVMRATRDIKKGEEILMPYRLPSVDHEVTQAELKKIWGFECDCSLCIAEQKTSRDQRQQRARLAGEMTTLLSANPVSDTQAPNDKKIAQIKKRLGGIESTYDKQAFDNRPRLALVAPGLWLCQAYHRKGQWNDVDKLALAVLRDLGFVVIITEDKIVIQRDYCHLIDEAIRASMFAIRAYQKLERANPAKQMEAFAKELYGTLNGTMRGFDEGYIES